ncbi:unnamed protein product [Mortierella alpina]
MFDNAYFIDNGQKVFVPYLAPSVPRNSEMVIFRTSDGHLLMMPVATTTPDEFTTLAIAAAASVTDPTTSSSACPASVPNPASSSRPGSTAPDSTPSLKIRIAIE